MNSLKPAEEKTLQAFLMALAQLDRPLSSDLQQTLHQLGNALAAKQRDAIAQLPAIASQDPDLNALYEIARQDLQQRYQAQERAKADLLTSDAIAFNLNLENFASQIFQSSDSVAAAQTQLKPKPATLAAKPDIWAKGDRIMAMASGGAFLGGAIGQIPGAILGAVLAGVYGWYTSSTKATVVRSR